MSQIGTLTANATTTFNLQFVPEFLVIGDVSGINIALETVIKGKTRIIAPNPTLFRGLSQVGMAGLLSIQEVSKVYQISNGGKGNETCQIKITNATATTPDVYAVSTGPNDGTVIAVSTSQVDANSNQEYKVFDKLAVDITNPLRNIQIKFANGWEDSFTVEEVNALLATMTPAFDDTASITQNTMIFDNQAGIFESVRIFAAGNAVEVMIQTTEFL